MRCNKNEHPSNLPFFHTFAPVLTCLRTHRAHDLGGAHDDGQLTQLPSGNWRVQVRRKKRYVAETFRRRKDGEEWALDPPQFELFLRLYHVPASTT